VQNPVHVTVSQYAYRADGLRRSVTVNNVRTTHVWSEQHIVLELNANNAIINRFNRSPRGGRMIHSYHHHWYLHNARGDVVQRVSNLNAQNIFTVLQNYRYSAFGIELYPNANNTNPFRFAGMYFDQHRNEYMTPNRLFNPRAGRWTQPDPFWGIHNMQGSPAAIAQSSNLFLFTMHNPVRWVDPTGLFAQIPRINPLEIRMQVIWRITQSSAQKVPSKVRELGDTGGEMIFLGSNSVLTARHSAVIMFIGQGHAYWDHRRFRYNDALFNGNVRFATIGAGPSSSNPFTNTLFADWNREGGPAKNDQGDIGIVMGTARGGQMKYITSSAGSVSALMEAGQYFIDNHNNILTYHGRPRVASNAFNSNSFTHALLLASGVVPPELSSSVFGYYPGWNSGPNLYARNVFWRRG